MMPDPPKECDESPSKDYPGWSCKATFRGGCFCFDAGEEALAMAGGTGIPAGEEFAARRPFTGKTMLVGIVLAEGCLPGHTCTAGIVTNPDELEGTKDVVVKKVRVPERETARGHATLKGIVVSSNQATRQPADGPITFTTPEGGAAAALALDVALADEPEEPVSVPIDELPPSHRKHHEEASAPPVLPDNGVCAVHDKFSGDGHSTKVAVNGTDVPVLAESQEVTLFRPGNAAKAGDNEYTITDNGVTKTYKLTAPSVSISASQTTLEQNQSAQFQVTVTLPASSIPDGSWSSDGEGGEGDILLTIKNDSPNTTTISGGNTIKIPIHKS